ncbi:peptide methionine sulfoxide reductase MsrA-like isoform X3 [Larus michahellis]|uniref:peptide methionine sulfoxide reductase MsrA-like isoform X3 n=1 Tax=Larus michahellis TaxID=119627 RepID=UPI003D9BCB1D
MPGAGVLPSPAEALPGRPQGLRVTATHAVTGNPTVPPFPAEMQMAIFGLTGHAEVVRVVFDPRKISYEELLKLFWENHDPTQGMRQQEDLGTQYRSVIYTLGPHQQAAALRSRALYQQELRERRQGDITTAIEPAGDFYYAEDRHQQYLHKVPGTSCGLKGTGVTCPVTP